MARPDDLPSRQDALYAEAAAEYGAALERLARAYEADPERRRDLVQEIHLALWRSCARWDGRCSLRTWVYRVAHNTASSQILRRRRAGGPVFVDLEQLDAVADTADEARQADDRLAMARVWRLIHRLQPLDRQIMLLYLEGLDAAAVSEVTGLSPGNVATKVHRVKKLLARRFHEEVVR